MHGAEVNWAIGNGHSSGKSDASKFAKQARHSKHEHVDEDLHTTPEQSRDNQHSPTNLITSATYAARLSTGP